MRLAPRGRVRKRPLLNLLFQKLDHLFPLFDLLFEQSQKALFIKFLNAEVERVGMEGTSDVAARGSLERRSQWSARTEHVLFIDSSGRRQDRSDAVDA